MTTYRENKKNRPDSLEINQSATEMFTTLGNIHLFNIDVIYITLLIMTLNSIIFNNKIEIFIEREADRNNDYF